MATKKKKAKDVLAELPRGDLSKSPELAAKQRRPLERLVADASSGTSEPDEVKLAHQQRLADDPLDPEEYDFHFRGQSLQDEEDLLAGRLPSEKDLPQG